MTRVCMQQPQDMRLLLTPREAVKVLAVSPRTPWALTASGDLAGVQLKGDGGYVVAPCSVHPSGHVYAGEVHRPQIAVAPDWLLGCLCAGLAANGAGTFFLSCRTAGHLPGVGHTKAAAMLRHLLRDGASERVEPHTRRWAAVYRCIG